MRNDDAIYVKRLPTNITSYHKSYPRLPGEMMTPYSSRDYLQTLHLTIRHIHVFLAKWWRHIPQEIAHKHYILPYVISTSSRLNDDAIYIKRLPTNILSYQKSYRRLPGKMMTPCTSRDYLQTLHLTIRHIDVFLTKWWCHIRQEITYKHYILPFVISTSSWRNDDAIYVKRLPTNITSYHTSYRRLPGEMMTPCTLRDYLQT